MFRMWDILPEDFSQCLLPRENLSLVLLPAIFDCYLLNACYCAIGERVREVAAL